MTTIFERRTKIEELKNRLKHDLFEAEKQYRIQIRSLEQRCSEEVAVLEREIKDTQAQEIRQARDRIKQIILDAGLDATIVLAGISEQRAKTGKTRMPTKPSTILHEGPDGKSWNGRGRTPKWLKLQRQQATNAGDARG